ncbi:MULTISPECIES: MmcQ/YjbR family DNA-binding protein [unclassified Siphonobacter]|uniref:MmcQ/YjbR family DNA-binding protein n=1 Tax=unclassified Siphonobacter TaxID=2635712 RepID=UPI000CB08017|nr:MULTISPECIES: MmcQ/YjbR family DNA-binding protein [unclassified Siphonobacter]MDQ1088957.1 putative DNA-binding protein (MmcQ/YjbR family) [Siphonobacter sp. SORGH_AS_1065]MDR6195138.1 putative DNA-binding protein (MmcQ/YjbR family) [Siphonobacter sp. SORGH_AS_0500]PKK38344.1 MmcQ-like protein [Siphonobacter sp. SORGH_AS_0500]
MNLELFREHCLRMQGVTEETPFGPDTLVYKVMGKVFALTPLDTESFSCNLKCDPERALELREQYDWIQPGYHMNKKHWNTVTSPVGSSDTLIKELTNHSYDLVKSSLPRKLQAELAQLPN